MPERTTENGFFYTAEDIKGEFEVTTKIGSEIPLDKTSRIEALNQSLKVAQAIGIDPGGRTAKVIGKLLMRDYGMREVEIALEQEIAELEQMQDITQKLEEGKQMIQEQEAQIAQNQQTLQQAGFPDQGVGAGAMGGNLPI